MDVIEAEATDLWIDELKAEFPDLVLTVSDGQTRLRGQRRNYHRVLRELRRLRRGIVHPIRFVVRFLRGAAAYTALIAAGWAALTFLPHHL